MPRRLRLPTALLAAALVLVPTVSADAGTRRVDERTRLLAAMTTELERNETRLHVGDHKPPYFISYTLRDDTSYDIQARYGAVYQDRHRHRRAVFVEVRVGSYQLDNSKVGDNGPFSSLSEATYVSRKDGPIDDDVDALRASLWLATDEKYKQALSDYLKMRADRVFKPDERQAPAFSHEMPNRFVGAPVSVHFDRARWRAEARRASRLFKAAPVIFDNLVRVSADAQTRYLTTTEGTRLVTGEVLYSLSLNAVTRAPDGMLLRHERSFYGRTANALPHGKALDAQVRRFIGELLALRKAPVMDPYTGPAILAPQATGVLFHEAIGHRLEGERQDNDQSGQTFKDQVGKQVIPTFLSVYDDPTLATWGKTDLNGYYRYDDEGVRAQRANLIQNGVLRGYLLSRAPVKGVPPHSNGHGRSQGNRDPIGRMANLVIAANPKSKRVVSEAELERRLVAEAKREGKPYGLIIGDIAGGDTNTSSYGYQAFRGTPTLAYRVDVKTGKKQLVRGVELVGTPLTVINKIVAASKDTGVFDGYCGAESGYVPVSTVAPATLITEVELQRKPRDEGRPPVLPPPWVKPKPR